MSDPLVSIVIPVYNGSDYLGQAIDSALAQTYPNTEVLVVDDGSTDGGATRSIALSYGPRLRYVSKPNGGVASALNVGIGEMRGELFSWLSHDDLYLPDKVESAVRFYRGLGNPHSVVYCDQLHIDADGSLLEGRPPEAVEDARLLYSLLNKRWIGGCTLLVPKPAFDDCGVFDECLRTVQDYHLWYRFFRGGYGFAHLARVGVYSRVHTGQDSRRKKDLHLREKQWLLEWAADNLPVELICSGFEDRGKALLDLALAMKRQDLRGACRRFARLGARFSPWASPRHWLLRLRVLTWSPLWRSTKRGMAAALRRCRGTRPSVAA